MNKLRVKRSQKVQRMNILTQEGSVLPAIIVSVMVMGITVFRHNRLDVTKTLMTS